ncbi:MAG: cytochrome c peroxidase, partial [Bacteroidales bacterium]|nr:cytochrome c peroxidase [Bacteroidales bacterium]
MKKLLLIFGTLLCILLLAFIVSRATENLPDPQESIEMQAAAVLENNGCLECHSATPRVPFYGNLPVVKNLVGKDIRLAQLNVNLDPALDAMKSALSPSEVLIAKIEHSARYQTMPPVQYSAIHWQSALSRKEIDILTQWAAKARTAYANGLAAKEFRNEPVQPVPSSLPTNSEKVALGKSLFNDVRLSGDNTLSCASCHELSKGGCDQEQFSDGINGQIGDINAPTVYNAVFNVLQFWDGRAKDLGEQAAGPPMNPVEMGSLSWDDIIAKLNADKTFTDAFLKVYPEGYSQFTITDAIAEYEKTLLTPDAPFDKYLKGDGSALTQNQVEGYELFKKMECATCHVGVNFGGQSFEYLGLADDYFAHRGNIKTPDNGRFNFTNDEADRHRFKTPTLRNLAHTHPYFHDGTVKTIDEAVEKMLIYQSGKKATKEEQAKIVDFLGTLNADITTVASR